MRSRLTRGLTALWVAFFLCVLVWHCWTAAAPPPWDDAWYLEVSFRLYHRLLREGPWGFAREYVSAFRFKAPLLSALPLPAYAVFGPSFRAAAAVNAAAALLLARSTYIAARELEGEAAGLLAVWIATTMPLLYGLSRRFLVEFPLAAVVAATLALLLRSLPPSRLVPSRALGLCLGAGLLLKAVYPLYVLGAAAYYVAAKRRQPGGAEALRRAVPAILGLGAGLAATWYAFNWMYVAGYALRAGFGDIGRQYAAGMRDQLLQAASAGVSWLHLAFGAGAAGALWLKDRRAASGDAWKLLGSSAALPLAALLCGTNKDVRFLAPVLPLLAALSAAAAARAWGGSGPGRALIAAWLALALHLFAGQTFKTGDALAYNGPPDRRRWDLEGLVESLQDRTRGASATIAVGVEHRALNANALSAWSALRGYPLSFVSLGYAQDSVESALIRLKEKRVSCLIMARGLPEGELAEFLNRPVRPLQERLDAGSLPFKKLAELPLTPTVTAALYGSKASCLPW